MSTQQQPLFAAPAAPTPVGRPCDETWLAQVREDAGRWWASTDRDGTEETCPLLAEQMNLDSWIVRHRASGGARVGNAWPDRRSARLWLWLALGTCQWQTLPDVATARGTYGEELDAAEARLRRALGGAV